MIPTEGDNNELLYRRRFGAARAVYDRAVARDGAEAGYARLAGGDGSVAGGAVAGGAWAVVRRCAAAGAARGNGVSSGPDVSCRRQQARHGRRVWHPPRVA